MRPRTFSLLPLCALLAALALPRRAFAQSDPAPSPRWLHRAGAALVVTGSLVSLAEGAALAGALLAGPQPQPDAVTGAVLGWGLALHALTVGCTIYGGVLLARGAAAPPRVAFAPYAGRDGGGLLVSWRF